MLLDDLVGVIELLKERIATHGASLRENETRTRMALIDPLLQALGWDVSDPKMVTPEYDVSGRKADYALLGACGSPSATVEAKKLGEPLASHRMQMLNYSNASDVEFAGLTDGDKWELYEVFKRGQLEDRRILDISIANTPAHEAALKLLLLWRPNLASGQPVVANAPVLVSLPSETPQFPVSLDPTTPATPIQTPDQASSVRWITLSKISPSDVTEYGNPKAIRFSNGYTKDIKNLRGVLTETANYMVETGKITATAFPNPSLVFINSSPNGPAGTPFRNYRAVSGGLYVNLNWNRGNLIKHSKRLLDYYGESPTTVELRFD